MNKLYFSFLSLCMGMPLWAADFSGSIAHVSNDNNTIIVTDCLLNPTTQHIWQWLWMLRPSRPTYPNLPAILTAECQQAFLLVNRPRLWTRNCYSGPVCFIRNDKPPPQGVASFTLCASKCRNLQLYLIGWDIYDPVSFPFQIRHLWVSDCPEKRWDSSLHTDDENSFILPLSPAYQLGDIL